MKLKISISVLLILAVGYIGASSYVISSQGIQALLVCSANGGVKVPFSNKVCQYYLFNFRGNTKDIHNLQKYGGAAFVLNQGNVTHEMRRTLSFLVSRGLDINGADESGIRPLQGAVLENSLAKVKLILGLGGNPLLAGKRIQLTPLKLAIKLSKKYKHYGNNEKIISTLREATQAAQQIAPADRHPATRAAGG